MHHLRGKFIVLDGPEGCGKSTQLRLLSQHLSTSGVDHISVRDPGTTRIGEKIRQILLSPEHAEMAMRCEMLLYMAARAQMMKEIILPALAAGRCVLCDRFVSSTLAYQLGGDGLTAEEIRRTADCAISGRWPDRVLILDIPPDKSFARISRERDRLEQRPLEYHQQVYRNYLQQVSQDSAHYRGINADQPAELVHQAILQALK